MLLVVFLTLFVAPIVLGTGVVMFVAAEDRGSRVMVSGITLALISGMFWGCLKMMFAFDVTRDDTGEETVTLLKTLLVVLVCVGFATTFVGSYFAMRFRQKEPDTA